MIGRENFGSGISLDHMINDSRVKMPAGHQKRDLSRILGFHQLIDMEAAKRSLGTARGSEGSLIVGFHGGFVTIAVAVFLSMFPDGLAVGPTATPRVISVQDHRAALFRSMRTL